jgi:hypothetical protein
MCNSPKVIAISDDWEQKDQFLQIVETSLRNSFLPVAYCPGTKERWQSYRDKYPDAKEVDSSTGMGCLRSGLKDRQDLDSYQRDIESS